MAPSVEVIWEPQAGGQEAFMSCPFFEALGHGDRGGGKTTAGVALFLQEVGEGYGEHWRGIIFRETYPQLEDIKAKAHALIKPLWPKANYNKATGIWEFPTGETLRFRHMAKPEDYWNYHGHEYPFIHWEELTNWASDECYRLMMSCCRSAHPDIPRMVRATTNPYGPGHNWVKDRFQLAGRWQDRAIVVRDPVDVDGNVLPSRAAVRMEFDQNVALKEADPGYRARVLAAARNPAERAAWERGDWDIVSGGMFDDVWGPRNVVPDFTPPVSWRIDRAFDWGSSRPFSVGWYAESDGSDLTLSDGTRMATVRGDLFRLREWYGSTGAPNEGLRMLAVDVAKGVVEREMAWKMRGRVSAGPADSAIYTVENGMCIADDMAKPVRIGASMEPGVTWTPADKRPGSRKMGWEMCRKMIRNATPENGRPRELPGLFVVGEHNPHFLRTMLALPRDDKDPDDVNTDAEDHIADEVRYRVRASGFEVSSSRVAAWY